MDRINPDAAWFAGITLGDGSLSGRMVRVWNKEDYIVDKWIGILNEQFDIGNDKIKIRKLGRERSGFRRSEETNEATVNSVEFNRKIRRLCHTALSSKDFNVIKSVMRGIFDAEGSICGRCEIVLWQRKNDQGTEIANFVRSKLAELGIEFLEDSDDRFYIIRVLGGVKNKDNIKKFSKLIGFSHPEKRKWLELDLEILTLNKTVGEREIINFLKERNYVTIKEMVLHFKVIETRIRRCLRKLEERTVIRKIYTWPRTFSIACA